MARKPKCWRWTAGVHGSTVVAFERQIDGPLYLGVPRPGGGYNRVSLGHTDKELAMKDAVTLAERRRVSGEGHRGALTVAALFSLYAKSVTGTQSAVHSRNTRRSADMWTRWLTPGFRVERFCSDEWEVFIRLRTSGELDAQGRMVSDPEKRAPAGPRAVARDLRVLRAACRSAMSKRNPGGSFVLVADPTRLLPVPVEKNPQRPVCDADRCDKLMAVADRVPMRVGKGRDTRMERSHLRTILRLASDTGRRVSSILALEWPDWRPDLGKHGKLRWRAEEDKIGKEWLAPVTLEVRLELEALRRERMEVGAVLLFPSPNDPTVPVCYHVARGWLKVAQKLAGLDHLPHGAWHPFRRRWASERKHLPLADVAAVGGWVETGTLQKCYITADEATMEQVINEPRRLRKQG